jgi:hypothetical protein
LALNWNNVDIFLSNYKTICRLCVDLLTVLKQEPMQRGRKFNLFTYYLNPNNDKSVYFRQAMQCENYFEHFKFCFLAKGNPTDYGILRGDAHNCELQ